MPGRTLGDGKSQLYFDTWGRNRIEERQDSPIRDEYEAAGPAGGLMTHPEDEFQRLLNGWREAEKAAGRARVDVDRMSDADAAGLGPPVTDELMALVKELRDVANQKLCDLIAAMDATLLDRVTKEENWACPSTRHPQEPK